MSIRLLACYLSVCATARLGLGEAAADTHDQQTPDTVRLVQPRNGDTVWFGDSVAFVWHGGGPTVTHYWFDISLDSNFQFRQVDSVLVDTVKRINISDLPFEPNYYWRVRAKSIEGWGPYSEVRFIRTAISSVPSDHNPNLYALEQNYPNPFNPTTTVTYWVAERTHVYLGVYSLLGQQVATLIDAEVDPGVYAVIFDGSRLASGSYQCRFVVKSTVQTRRLILLR